MARDPWHSAEPAEGPIAPIKIWLWGGGRSDWSAGSLTTERRPDRAWLGCECVVIHQANLGISFLVPRIDFKMFLILQCHWCLTVAKCLDQMPNSG